MPHNTHITTIDKNPKPQIKIMSKRKKDEINEDIEIWEEHILELESEIKEAKIRILSLKSEL